MSKKVWLYTEKKKDLGIYYCVDDGWYYYKDMRTVNLSLGAGIAVIWSIIFKYLCKLTFRASTWNILFVVTNVLILIFLVVTKKNEEKMYHKYYPERNQFINNMAAIKKTYLAQIISTIIAVTLIITSLFCWTKFNGKLVWLAFEVASVMLLYINIAINGMTFKRKVIEQIKCGEI